MNINKTGSGLWTMEFGMWIADCGIKNISHSTFRIPHFAKNPESKG